MSAGLVGVSRRTGVAGTAARVVFAVQPATAVYDTAFTTQPVVEVRDAYGAVISGSSATVVITKERGAGAAAGAEAAGKNASSGVTTFTNIKIARRGRHTLLASSTGLVGDQSIEIRVGNVIRMESNDYLLMETGDLLITEA